VGGRLVGDGEQLLRGLAPLDRAGPDSLTFLLSPAYLAAFQSTRAGATLVSSDLAGVPGPPNRIVVHDPAKALRQLAADPAETPAPGVDPTARIAGDVSLEPGCSVGPYAVLERGVTLGARTVIGPHTWLGAGVSCGPDCHIGPHAVCYPGVRMGARVVLKAGAVIGGPGFGFHREADGPQRLPHFGGCVLEDEVEIGSGTCVDRGRFEDTVIGAGTKVDNLVQIGHNVRIGARCLIMATTGIAGSCDIGDDVVIAGGVGIADHAIIGTGAVIGAKSVVFGPGRIPPNAVVSGYPARSHRVFLRAQAAMYRLAPHAEALLRLVGRQGDASTDHTADR
jgi:UDP-3-O-[3-hydroxymyristoyl] glucosamine N-acyltransferase